VSRGNVTPFRARSSGSDAYWVRSALTGVVRAMDSSDGSSQDVDQYNRPAIAAGILVDRLDEIESD
jgi:hypothetical protein